MDTSKSAQQLKIAKAFPNPFQDQITLETKSNDTYIVRVFSADGQQLIREEFAGQTKTFDVSSLSSGIYFLKIRMKTSKKVQTIQLSKTWAYDLFQS